MRFLKQSARRAPRLSLILLDWSVRESFHLLYYLRQQSVDRDQFEVIVIEFYSRIAEPLKQFAGEVDTWVLLEMPEACIYHKHLMYNCGLALAHGEVVVLCDSDAMVKDSFIETILFNFRNSEKTVLHLDQFRNVRRDLYPFKYPSFEEVLGEGCINNVDGKTAGIVDRIDPLHSRNYGACMCARRADLIEIGGADEHIDYLGHICGPYEMTFRLLNNGFKEVWDETEYLYHTWHPGQAGVDNYQGPHDGRQMSSSALESLITGRVYPLVENKTMRLIKDRERLSEIAIMESLVDKRYLKAWDRSLITDRQVDVRPDKAEAVTDIYRGFKIIKHQGTFYVRTLLDMPSSKVDYETCRLTLESGSIKDLVTKIDRHHPIFLRFNEQLNTVYSRISLLIWAMALPLIGILKMIFVQTGRDKEARSHRIHGAGLGVSWPDRLRRSWEKYVVGWSAVKNYRAYLDHGATNLITSLYFAKPGMLLAIVLTTSRFVQIYLTGLSTLGIVPCLQVKRVKDKAAIQRYLDELSHGDDPEILIVARDIYANYYGLFKDCSHLKQVIVV